MFRTHRPPISLIHRRRFRYAATSAAPHHAGKLKSFEVQTFSIPRKPRPHLTVTHGAYSLPLDAEIGLSGGINKELLISRTKEEKEREPGTRGRRGGKKSSQRNQTDIHKSNCDLRSVAFIYPTDWRTATRSIDAKRVGAWKRRLGSSLEY